MIENTSNPTPSNEQGDNSILGLSTTELAGLTVDEIQGNKTAITMLMHYYKQLLNQNTSLKNDLNTASTYVTGYERKKTYSSISAILLGLSNVVVGFGVNLLTAAPNWAGYVTFGSGVIILFTGLYYSQKQVN